MIFFFFSSFSNILYRIGPIFVRAETPGVEDQMRERVIGTFLERKKNNLAEGGGWCKVRVDSRCIIDM